MSIKIVCDVCGQEASSTKYIVPVYIRSVLLSKLHGKTPSKDEEIGVGEINLCNKHRFELAKFLSIIQEQ